MTYNSRRYKLGPRPRTHILQLSVFVCCLAVVLPCYFSSRLAATVTTELSTADSSIESSGDPRAYVFLSDENTPPLLIIDFDIQTINPVLLTTSIAISMLPVGDFSAASVTGEGADKEILTFQPRYIKQLLSTISLGPANETQPAILSLVLVFTRVGSTEVLNFTFSPELVQDYRLEVNKSLSYYPMDQYFTEIHSKVYLKLKGVNTTDGLAYTSVPFAIRVGNLVSGWVMSPSAKISTRSQASVQSRSVQVTIQMKRLALVQGLSIFIVIVM